MFAYIVVALVASLIIYIFCMASVFFLAFIFFLPVVVGSCFCSCVCIIFHLTERVYMRACVHVCALWVSVFMCFVYIFVVGSFWHKMKKISLFLSPTTSQRRRRVAATPPNGSAINSPQQRCAATTRPDSPCWAALLLRCCCYCWCCSACSQSCLQILSLQ